MDQREGEGRNELIGSDGQGLEGASTDPIQQAEGLLTLFERGVNERERMLSELRGLIDGTLMTIPESRAISNVVEPLLRHMQSISENIVSRARDDREIVRNLLVIARHLRNQNIELQRTTATLLGLEPDTSVGEVIERAKEFGTLVELLMEKKTEWQEEAKEKERMR